MRTLPLIALLLVGTSMAAQPLQPSELEHKRGHYIFTVVHPASYQEAQVWTFGKQQLTTHRLIDGTDSTVIYFSPLTYPHLRTFFTTEAHSGAVAGAREVVIAADNSPSIEVLHYPALLSPQQRQLTESYLAIKHGLTLSQRQPTNYLRPAAGGSQPVWTATAAREYHHRIIGLAHDPASSLFRQRGNAAVSPKLLNIEWLTSPDSLAYLVLADNGAPTARLPGSRILGRQWRVETTGAVPPTTFSWDTRQFFDRAQPGEAWVLTVALPDRSSINYRAVATTDARLVFEGVQFPANGDAIVSLAAATAAAEATSAAFFTDFSVSPNPVRAGQAVQFRAVTAQSVALEVTVHDTAGRQTASYRLPATTHHLREVTFPAPGTYTLHLRPRTNVPNASPLSLKVVVQ